MRRTKHILVLGTGSEYERRILKGIHAYCFARGNWEFHLGEHHRADRLRQALFAGKADGIIVRLLTRNIEKLVQIAALPTVNFGASFRFSLPTVTMNNTAIGRMVARHFLENGFRHFAFISNTFELYAQERCEGFVREITDVGLECEVFAEKYVGFNEPDWIENRQKIDSWLLSLKKPVAILCIHDLRGHEVSAACRRLGLRVPEDIALVSVDNEEILCQMSTPPLSSVDIDLPRIGFESARLLDRLMRGAKPPLKPVLIEPRCVVVRQSSNVIAIDDPEVSAAMQYIREHASQPFSVKDILGHIPISRRALEKRFERILGHMPGATIARVHLERAKNLLAETNWSMDAVARNSGFKGQEIFAASFRRQTGLTPTQYRRNYRRSVPVGIPGGMKT